MTLPPGVSRKEIQGDERLATRGEPVYGEPAVDGWRAWDITRSKLGVLIDRGVPVGLAADASVLYLGAAAGTTVSHVADIAGPVYAVEFAARPMRDLVRVAESRGNVFPLLKDARRPESYAHVVEAGIDVVIQDVATRGQAEVAMTNKRFLHDEGWLVAMVKARSESVTAPPGDVYASVLEALDAAFEIVATERLDPVHADHLGVIARPRP